MQNFRDLKVWQKAHAFVLNIYKVTRSFPDDERFGLTSQIRRAAMSIPSNIAEGCGRGSDPDFARFLQTAMGSASEVAYQLQLAHDLKYIIPAAYHQLNDECVPPTKRRSRPDQENANIIHANPQKTKNTRQYKKADS